jgi:type I restriction enzyme S subunit
MSTAATHIDNKLSLRGTKQSHPLFPELRFKEFEGQFQLKEFDEITDITRLAGYEYSKYWKEDEEQEIIALRGYNIGKGELNLRDLGYISNELSLQLKRSRLSIGDIVYPCVGTIGNAVVIEENDKFHIQQNIAKITCNDFASPYYVVQFLSSDYGLKEVYRFNASGAQPNVLVGSLRKYRINIPSLPEQQKIASFLSAVDEKIQQLTKKKALLEQYKKGVMQQLFTGQLRFKDENGKDYPDWEECEIDDLIKRKILVKPLDGNHGNIHPVSSDFVKEGIPFIMANSFKKGHLDISGSTCIKQEQADKLQKGFSYEGDVLLTHKGSVGLTAIVPKLETDYIMLTPQVTYYRIIDNSILSNTFLKHSFDSTKFQKRLKVLADGGTRPYIGITLQRKLDLALPAIEEQQKIATYLSGIDTKIEAVTHQITQTQTFKKGLLQQMFV